MQNRVVVEIFGEKYPLKTDANEEHIKALAAMVNTSMRDIAGRTRNFSGERIGVMAALQLAEKYCLLQRDYQELLELVTNKGIRTPDA